MNGQDAISSEDSMTSSQSREALFARTSDWLRSHPRLFVITGAGISTASGIPDYRDHEGNWKRNPPVQHADFMKQPACRQRFWARSLVGWPVMSRAQPNAAHRALADWEQRGKVELLVTQNVDGLHQKAGSQQVVDLHGRSADIRCMSCGLLMPRDEHHQHMALLNPDYAAMRADTAPDGDADLDGIDFSHFRVVDCPACNGILKPDVVFYGDHVPRERVDRSFAALEAANGVLVIGTSLMVFSSFRFCRRAHELGKPMIAINMGKTRADDLLHFKLPLAADLALPQLSSGL
ncbi:NAD-dependent protein deacetylase [Pokkaliibacter plantistimulans]|nr:NAD-dependent protein deacetylase [Pokkaliibacter plantistimulans]